MTIPDSNYAGYSEGVTIVFTWLADKVLGGANKALAWRTEHSPLAAVRSCKFSAFAS